MVGKVPNPAGYEQLQTLGNTVLGDYVGPDSTAKCDAFPKLIFPFN